MFRTLYRYFFMLFALYFSASAIAAIPSEERNALIKLYNSTGGGNWTNNTGWLGAVGTECNWHGVTCNSTDHVINVLLSKNNLRGTMPRGLEKLSQLRALFLAENQLSGTIPRELGQLIQLQYLYLLDNLLNGSIPEELGDLRELEHLVLYGNQFSGTIPKELGELRNLIDLRLSNNELSGSIPRELGKLGQLTRLYLHKNQLSGTIPRELGQLSQLKELSLYVNQLSGTIPSELGQLSQLIDLRLFSNELSGSIPKELGELGKLELLALFNNQLSGNIPRELGELSQLIDLRLFNNELSGSIPKELGELAQLERLYLQENKLSGSLPNEFVNLSNLSIFSIYNNCLSLDLESPPILDRINELDIGNQDICDSFANRQHIPITITNSEFFIKIPLISVAGQFYSVTLNRYKNPLDEQGLYWKLLNFELIDDANLELQVNPAVEFDTESFELTFNKIHYREQIISATLFHYNPPDDTDGFYFQYLPEEDTSYPIPEIETWKINVKLLEVSCGRGIVVEDIKDTLTFDGENYRFTNVGFVLTDHIITRVFDLGLGVTVTEINVGGNILPDGSITQEDGNLVFTSGKEGSVVGIFVSLIEGNNECSKSWTIVGTRTE